MGYLLLFLEGVITFISPCLLPMLPVYLSYFTGQESEKHKVLLNAVGFVIGFSIFFVSLGAFAGQLGSFLREQRTVVNIVCGVVIIFFGLNFIGLIRLPLINNNRMINLKQTGTGFYQSVLLGIVFSISWTPCVGTFLGSALMLAAQEGNGVRGVSMLLSFSLGLGVPFIISALVIDRLKGAFDFIKQHYRTVTFISGSLLVVLGLFMATGMIDYFYDWL